MTNQYFTTLIDNSSMKQELAYFFLTPNKKDPIQGQFINGGNYVANLEPYLDKLQTQLAEKHSQKVIFMLKFLQERKIA